MSGKMLGKRQRSQAVMRRTTSLASVPSAAKQGRQAPGANESHARSASLPAGVAGNRAARGSGAAAAAQRKVLGNYAAVETAAFLRNCGLCNTGLGPGKDTYIYRGEVAFCSQECRERQIEYDERGEQNCSLTSIREAPSVSSAGGSDQSGNVAAA